MAWNYPQKDSKANSRFDWNTIRRGDINLECGSYSNSWKYFQREQMANSNSGKYFLFFCCCRSSLLCCNELGVVYEAILVLVIAEKRKNIWLLSVGGHCYLSSMGSIIFFNSSSAKILASGAGRPDLGSWFACKVRFREDSNDDCLLSSYLIVPMD